MEGWKTGRFATGLNRCSHAGETPKPTGEEAPAKKMKTEETPVGSEAPTVEEVVAEEKKAAKKKKKKTKKAMKKVSDDHVQFVLAAKPTPRSRLPPELQPTRRTEERQRQSARVDEIINSINEYKRRLQDKFRHELDTKGYVEVEVEVTDDEAQA